MPEVVEIKQDSLRPKMKTPPACQYLIVQPVWLNKTIVLFLLLSLMGLIFFAFQQFNNSFQSQLIGFILFFAFLVSTAALMHYVKTYLKGLIYFTGQNWEFQSQSSLELHHSSLIQLDCIWDLRSKMLLQIKINKHKKYWVIIEYIQEPQQWQAVRRAVLDI